MLPLDDSAELQRIAGFIVEHWKNETPLKQIITHGNGKMMNLTREDILEVVRLYVDKKSENYTLSRQKKPIGKS